jgi:hypothetical protein
MALCLSWINKIIPTLQVISHQDGVYVRPIATSISQLDNAKRIAPKELAELSYPAMLLKPYEKIQKTIMTVIV